MKRRSRVSVGILTAPSKEELFELRNRLAAVKRIQSSPGSSDSIDLEKQLSCKSVLPHHLLTMKDEETSYFFQVMVHIPSCSHPKPEGIEHVRSDGIGAQVLGQGVGSRFPRFPYGGSIISCELVSIEHAEIWQIHGDLKKPKEIDTSNMPNYRPYHHGGE